MTRSYNERIRCPQCGHDHTTETAFERWMRNNNHLDSVSESIVRFDLDLLLHRYKSPVDGKGTREIQCMMFIEVKTFSAKISEAQKDTLGLLNQVLRNRKPNIHSKPRRQVSGQIRKAYSAMIKRDVALHLYGGHLLQLSGACPETSDRMIWDNQYVIDQFCLTELLKFKRDPDRPELLIDLRRRSQSWAEVQTQFDM